MPEITRDGSIDDLLSGVAEETGDFCPDAEDFEVQAGDHVRLFRSTISHPVRSAEDRETLIPAVICQGKKVQHPRPCKPSFPPV